MAEGPLRAGFARVEISPPDGVHAGCWALHTALAEGSHDPLEIGALVLARGETRVALVGLDLCIVEPPLIAEARRRCAELTGIPAEAVLINLSHDHAAPRLPAWSGAASAEDDALAQYMLTLPSRIAGAVYAASRRLAPARVGFGTARAPGASVNRVDRNLPVDDRVWVMRVDSPAGEPRVLAVSFACHPVVIAGQTRLFDTDYPGPLRTRLRRELGAETVFLQGAAGDVAPFDFWFGNPSPRPHSFECRDDLASAVGDAALAAARGAGTMADLELGAVSTTLQLPRRRLPWSEEELAARAARIPLTPEEDYPELWAPTVHTATSAQQFPDYYQLHQVALYRSLLARREVPLAAELQAIRLGEHALSANPFEPFTGLAAAIEQASPFPDTRVLGYSNGYSGYLPPPADYAKIDGVALDELLDQDRWRWAYGITTAFVGPDASATVIEESVRQLEALR